MSAIYPEFAVDDWGIVNSGVVSRPFESRAVAEFLRHAAQRPSGLVIEGEAGIGKTTVWLAAVEQARERGFQVISARVGQAESVLAYAAVADLFGDVAGGGARGASRRPTGRRSR